MSKRGKYKILEISFFIIFFFAFPILTDIEYNLKEEPCQGCDQSFLILMLQRILWGLYQVPPYLFLYKYILKGLLLSKKYGQFLIAFVLFLFALNLYIVYVEYWTISKLTFLPSYITSTASKWFQTKTLFHFSIIYIINETLVFTALAYYINYAKQEERINALKQGKLESDLNYLKAQIQPHFFFNTLNNIYSLALKQSTYTAPLVSNLSDMMRYIIYETTNPRVSLKNEIEFLQNYIDIQSVRYNEHIVIRFDTQGVTENTYIEPLLLLPFIENAFKHGVEEETTKGFINIVIMITEKELSLQTSNSKPTPSLKKEIKDASGMGLQNVKQRLDLLYPGKHTFDIKDTDAQFDILVTIQLH